ncbi:hypothetical protein TNIN_418021 [Trichonephila inaurata madagascariensis]|uniref:Uncharacterized protein n=1 Tax=Trichonephila inaurata madagascariensis TaxID=2747483 RepID=A0A8X6Y7M9_9ARAC|nr:hypothetical protein TNIN_418021 [Trichonephila inaurata madagascariensis]
MAYGELHAPIVELATLLLDRLYTAFYREREPIFRRLDFLSLADGLDGSSWSPSLIGSSLSGSPRMNRPVPPGTPYRNQDLAYSTLSPKSPLLSPKDRGSSPATSQIIH